MGSKLLPYSLCVQVPLPGRARGTFVPPAVHESDEECTMPKLWPGSWASTTQPEEALYQLSRCGRSEVPRLARPAQPQPACRVPKYQRYWSKVPLIIGRMVRAAPLESQPEVGWYLIGPMTWPSRSCR